MALDSGPPIIIMAIRRGFAAQGHAGRTVVALIASVLLAYPTR